MDYLASGFQEVDKTGDVSSYLECLALLNSLEFFQAYKRKSFELLELAGAFRILDIGCGLGEDALAMAELAGPACRVTGIDTSRAMIEQARGKAAACRAHVTFQQADALLLPFPDAAFDRIRVDRTLQHIDRCERAIREIARVTAPGGVVVAFDNDWETFTLSSSNRSATRCIANYWCDSFASGWVGRYLRKYFRENGLIDIQIHSQTLMITDLELADKVFNIFQTVHRVSKAGLLEPAKAESLLTELKLQNREGLFFCSYTGFLAVGRKP
jgi:ubiquinone/menaquinone biosynthesis C-methylase UbiE